MKTFINSLWIVGILFSIGCHKQIDDNTLKADFSFEVLPDKPTTVQFKNLSTNAKSATWILYQDSYMYPNLPMELQLVNDQYDFKGSGNFKIELVVSDGIQQDTVRKQVVVKIPNNIKTVIGTYVGSVIQYNPLKSKIDTTFNKTIEIVLDTEVSLKITGSINQTQPLYYSSNPIDAVILFKTREEKRNYYIVYDKFTYSLKNDSLYYINPLGYGIYDIAFSGKKKK